MSNPASDHEQVQLRLGLYALGALPEHECFLVEEHLAVCGECRTVGTEFADVRGVLDRLSPEDIASLADEFSPVGVREAEWPAEAWSVEAWNAEPWDTEAWSAQAWSTEPWSTEPWADDWSADAPSADSPSAAGPPHAWPPAGWPSDAPAAGRSVTPRAIDREPPAPAAKKPAAPALPGQRRRAPKAPPSRPDGTPSRPAAGASRRPAARPTDPNGRAGAPRGHALRLVFSVIAAALLLGAGVGVWLVSNQASVAVALTGSDTSTATGVSMSVHAVERDGRSYVEATVAGLTPGKEYQLYAVDVRSQTVPVARWAASTSADTITGDIAVAAADIAFFSVAETSGAVAVTVRVVRSG
jgi:hypothetical protein